MYASPGKRRRQKRKRKWTKWVERRRYRRSTKQRTIAIVFASQDQHQTGGKQSLKVTPSWERPPTVYGPLGVGHSVPILGSLYDRNQKNQITDPSKKGQEASLELTAAGVQTPDSKVRDHLLLTVQAVVHGTFITCTGG